ncbi:MAG: hypothetical protein JSR61_09285 [Proteobacteria bacterium]|nr:hypothetical protein [Pseudomonadota bacterium]
MTLSERREPTFHAVGRGGEAFHAATDHHAAALAHHPVKPASHFTRFVSGFQAISTLIGVPLALASGYSLYRANFSPETTCGNLRASIVQMLDKNVDAATRRMLVKRDVEAFEQSCGAVDPDAHAAFKALLAADKTVAQAAPAARPAEKPAVKPAAKPAAVAAKEISKETSKEAKAELRPAIAETRPAAVAKVEPRAEGMSDTRWLDAVRQALVEPAAERPQVAKAEPVKPEPMKVEAAKVEPAKAELSKIEAAKSELSKSELSKSELAKADPANAEPAKAAVKPVVPSKPGEPVLQPAWSVTPPAGAAPPAATPPNAAPLPQAVEVSARPEPASGDHPVPPGIVPSTQYATDSSWIGKIPFVGRMIDR